MRSRSVSRDVDGNVVVVPSLLRWESRGSQGGDCHQGVLGNKISRQWTDDRINCGEGGTEVRDIAQILVRSRRNDFLQDVPSAIIGSGTAGIAGENNPATGSAMSGGVPTAYNNLESEADGA